MGLIKQSYLRQRAQQASGYHVEANVRTFAANSLLNEKRAASRTQTYDVFLSHASEDAILIKGLRDELVSHGYSVYVDWIEDPQLDRSHVTKESAAVLRARMGQCRSLLFATSTSSKQSIWMPWELGYVDSKTNSRVAVAPIVPDDQASSEFKGQEYLGLYPYLDLTGTTLYIHESLMRYVRFSDWLTGTNPS